jgi:WD40 repeat protein
MKCIFHVDANIKMFALSCMQVWRNIKISQLIEDSGHVIFVHKITENCAMTVAKDGKMKYWLIEDFKWRELYEFSDNDGTIIYSCLSSFKLFLAMLKDELKVVIYKMPNIENEQWDNIKIECHMKYGYKQQLNSCEFSQDEKYLAIALDGGDISVSTGRYVVKRSGHSLSACLKIVGRLTVE